MAHHTQPDEPVDEQIDPTALVVSAAEHIVDQARRHPYRTIGIALGVGYVLGGGLPRFVVRMAGMAALRSVGNALLTSDTAIELARSVLAGGDGPAYEATAPHGPPCSKDNGGSLPNSASPQ